MLETAVNTALDNVRPGLEADGFDLRLDSIGADGAVEVILEAKPDACMDCLVPDEMLVAILETAIRDQDPGLDHVVLIKQGFESVAEH